MAQINQAKSNIFTLPGSGRQAWAFNGQGAAGYVNEQGVFVALAEAVTLSAVVANKGIGDTASLPVSPSTGDVYVTNDTYLVYTALSGSSWGTRILKLGEFVTDTSGAVVVEEIIYQYLGAFIPVAGRGVAGEEDFEATPAQTVFTVSDFLVIAGKVGVARGGSLQPKSQVTGTNGQEVTIAPAAADGEFIKLIQR